jgi:hypothetical protein
MLGIEGAAAGHTGGAGSCLSPPAMCVSLSMLSMDTDSAVSLLDTPPNNAYASLYVLSALNSRQKLK